MLPMETIRGLIADFREKWVPELVDRTVEVDLLLGKVASLHGPRRAGKTFVLFQLARQAERAGLPRQSCLYVNFEDERILPVEAADLGRIVDEFSSGLPTRGSGEVPLILLDEIQNVEGWPVALRRLADSGEYRLAVTGSSSHLLARDLSTRLRGRSLGYEILPFSFREVAVARNVAPDSRSCSGKSALDRLLADYLRWGGYPEVWLRADSDLIRRMLLQDYFNMTFYRDMADRHGVSNTALLKVLLKYLAANAGCSFSANRFHGHLKSSGWNVSKDSIYRYLDHAEDASLFFLVPIYSRSVREQAANPKKVYCVDSGLRNAVAPPGHEDGGRMLEQAVFLELRRRGFDVCYFRGSRECDFVASQHGEPVELLQVALEISSAEALARELAGLDEAAAAIPGTKAALLVGDYALPERSRPARVVSAAQWLASTRTD
jgi:predicted AAA+ superfamily ATPase